jgi:hypothetical protein
MKLSRNKVLIQAGFSLGLFFDSEDGGEMLHRNVCWLSADCIVFYPRR